MGSTCCKSKCFSSCLINIDEENEKLLTQLKTAIVPIIQKEVTIIIQAELSKLMTNFNEKENIPNII